MLVSTKRTPQHSAVALVTRWGTSVVVINSFTKTRFRTKSTLLMKSTRFRETILEPSQYATEAYDQPFERQGQSTHLFEGRLPRTTFVFFAVAAERSRPTAHKTRAKNRGNHDFPDFPHFSIDFLCIKNRFYPFNFCSIKLRNALSSQKKSKKSVKKSAIQIE